MGAWQQALRELRSEYAAESRPKLAYIVRLLERISEDAADRPALEDLHRRFHAMSGSGTTYGFPQVSALATEGERSCATMIREAAMPAPADLERLRALVAGIDAQFNAPAAEAPDEGVAGVSPVSPSPRILVIDDDETVRDSLTERLRQAGMIAESVATKAEAMAFLERRQADGIIVDVTLPDGSGYELVEHLRTLPGGEAPAVLMLSLRTGFLDKVEAIRCGADGFFERPMDWDALLRRLQHLLETMQAEPGRVLSVEDDPRQASFLRAVLQSGGYEVRVCEDPKRFETELAGFRPDLILMDVLLPGVSGYDLVRFVRQDEKYATLPILFLTTQAEAEAQIATARAGGDGHLIKPVLPGLLLSAVAARIERARFLKTLVGRDGLTRLLTHTGFVEQARAVLARKKRDPARSAAWVMFDLDHFKAVNDQYGHPVGDRVLTSLSALLRRRLRQTDTMGRYGGEEFAVLLEDLGQDEAMRLVSRLLEEFRLAAHRAPDGSPFHVTFSAGLAMLDPWMDFEWWRRTAEDAVNAAKAQGRARVVMAAPSNPPAAAARG